MRGISRFQFENRLRRLQGGLCAVCGQPMRTDERYHDDFSGWTLDHVYPRCRRQGISNRGNFLLAHRGCNIRKGNRDPTGCEIILLHAVNAKLRREVIPTPAKRQTAIELAWQRMIEKQATQREFMLQSS